MSIKKYFDVTSNIKSLAGTTTEKVSSQVESPAYHAEQIKKDERYIPHADYSAPQGFAHYGSAEEYYTQAIRYISNTFPYDGSLRERLEWENESTYLDLHIYENQYPRTNGYINFAAGGWGTPTALSPNGYGIPASSANYEYIFVKGGPNQNPNGATPYRTQFTGSNYYEPSMNRASNFSLDVTSRGVSLEFWLKKTAFSDSKTQKEVIFDLWNGVTASATNYGRLRLELTSATGRRGGYAIGESPFLLTLYSGSTGFFQTTIASDTITTTGSVADNKWHHYAVSLKQESAGVTTRFYVDGRLNREQQISASGKGTLQDISGKDLRANVGALITSPRRWTTATYAGKLSASLDEFRFWKTQRTSQQIGRFWFTQVGGGVNTDPEPYIETPISANVDLGVYFKFNEGITTTASVDSTVLDYSGRVSNGAWTCPAITAGNYTLARNTGSAIVESSAAIKEYKDPIIYEKHASVQSLLNDLQLTGSSYDVNNNAAIYNTIPSWIIAEDADGDGELRKLTQIIGSYFDTLHLQIQDLNSLKNSEYVSGSNKPLPFSEKLLSNYGFVAPEIFLDADILNTLANRSEDKVFEKSLEEVKNLIYQNIYNNLVYIYKSKGTVKAFRNLIRCFGIDDELVKLNMYANNVEFEMRNNRRNISVADRFVNFNTGDNKTGVVYNYRDPSNPQSAGYMSASAALLNGHAITMESEILFPLKPTQQDDVFSDTNTISSSLFGVHGAHAAYSAGKEGMTTWASNDNVNFQLYAVRDESSSDNVRFVLTSSGPNGKVPYITSDLYQDVYNNTRWNLAVRIKPEKYPLSSFVDGATAGNYTVELHGTQAEAGELLNQFTVSKTITAPAGFITGSRRAYIGAHRTNFTGSLLAPSDVKVNACRFWLDYVEDDALNGHILDTQNYGNSHPHWYAYPFKPSSSYGEIQKLDTLVFNWEFLTNTGSSPAGRFTAPDLTSGSLISSTNPLTASYGSLGRILNPQYPGRGDLFATSSTTAIEKDFVISSKLNLPENLRAEEMVKVLNAQDQDVFTSDTRPTNYSFVFEKSMYQVISEEMINYFATLKDLHNVIGDPVNQWRPEYKSMKFLRQKFFENVENKELDFDKFYEYYKWFDSSLSAMLQQLAPVSADVAENVRTVIEDHILERPKYQRKFPFLQKSDTKYPTGITDGNMGADKTAQASPDEFPPGTSFFTNTAYTKRQIGSSNTSQARPWKHFHAPLSNVVENLSPGKSLLFDGADEYMNIGTAATWDALIGGSGATAKAFSFSFWLKPAAWVDSNPGIITFGTLDRGLICNIGTGPANTRLFAKLDTGGTYGTIASAGALTINVWQHVTVTYAGGNTVAPKIYVNASETPYDVQSAGSPQAIAGLDCVVAAEGTDGASCLAGNMADVAVWSKELSAAEVTEIYGSGTRIKLTTTSCQSNLISWWMMGNGNGDSATGTIYDQRSTNNGTPVNMEAADLEEDSPSFKTPYGYIVGTPANENIYWHRYMEPTDLVSTAARYRIGQVVSQSFYRRTKSPVKFGVEGTTAVAGVGKHHNAVVNYVFQAARAWGNLGTRATGKGIPVLNKLVSSGSSVEELIPSTDVFYPSYKQRLGFTLSSSNGETVAGPTHAPFSLYSSSVTTGYNAEVVKNYASGVMLTNLHNDFVINTDIPMQGPFTEKYVGGRFYRHTTLNKGTDNNRTRGEGFRIEFDNPGMGEQVVGVAKKSLVILPPNSRTGSVDPDELNKYSPENWPTAYRFRDVTAKRPVNIRNIRMTTGSTIIGNYEKNYQVVNSNSRMKNDPFFKDQSFNFALYPETLATRGRFPLVVQKTTNTTTRDQTDFLRYKSRPDVDGAAYTLSGNLNHGGDLASHPQETISIWFSASKNTVQQVGPAWTPTGYGGLGFPAQYSGEERVLYAWGGIYNQDIQRRVFLKSGSNASTSDGSKGPRLGISIGRGTTINGYYWISDDDIFTSPGWYHVVFSTDQLNWKTADFLGRYAKASRESLAFDGTDDYLNLINGATTAATWEAKIGSYFGSTSDWTMSFWLRPGTNATGKTQIISFNDSGGNVVHGIGYVDDARYLTYYSDNMSASAPMTSQALAQNIALGGGWNHYTATFAVSGGAGSQVKLYRNGSFVSKFAAVDAAAGKNSLTIDGPCKLGQAPGPASTYLTGALCDFAIWDKVLTLDEIKCVSGWRGADAPAYAGPVRPDLNALVGTSLEFELIPPSAGHLISFWPLTFSTEEDNSAINYLKNAALGSNPVIYNKARCRSYQKNLFALSASNFADNAGNLFQSPAFISSSTISPRGYGTHQRYQVRRNDARKGAAVYVNGVSVGTSSAFQSGSQHGGARTGSNGLFAGSAYGGMSAFAPIYGGQLATENSGQPYGATWTGIGQIAYWRAANPQVAVPPATGVEAAYYYPYAPMGGAHASSSTWVNNFMRVKTTSSYQAPATAECTPAGDSPGGGVNRGWTDLTSSTPHAGFNYSQHLTNWWKFSSLNPGVNDRGPANQTFQAGWDISAAPSASVRDNYAQLAFSASELAAYGGGTWSTTTTGKTANCEGNLNFLVPMRTGSDSQESIIVNRYAGSGYEVMSLGYMDPAHTEMSVYNAAPYHNLAIIDHGLSGNVPADPIAAQTISVVDQIGKNRGLDQRAALHCGKFGADAAFGPGVQPSSSYPALPSWHKTNRNRKRRMYSSATRGGYYTASVYDNLFVQHAIPRSPQQYAWITASVVAGAGNAPMTFSPPGALSGTVLSQLVTGSSYPYYGKVYRNNFAGFSGRMIAPRIDIQSRTTLVPDAGLYSARWNGTSTALNMGTSTTWNALIGNSGASAEAFSVSLWMFIGVDTDNEYNTMWSFGTADRYLLYVNSSGYQYLQFAIADAAGSPGRIRTNFAAAPPGEWLHVVCTFAGGDPGGSNTDTYMKIYINGIQSTAIVMDQLNNPSAISGDPGMIGAWAPLSTVSAGSSNLFQGSLADVCVWDTALSAVNIKNLYNNGRQIDVKSTLPTNLIAWWPMDQFRGDTGASVKNVIGTAGTNAQSAWPREMSTAAPFLPGNTEPTAPLMERKAPGGRSLNIQLNNQNGPYGWPTWKQIRAGHSLLGRALRKQNYIGQVVPPGNVEKLIRGSNGSMVRSGFLPGKTPNRAVLYWEPPLASSNGPVEFYFEDNTEDSDVANNMKITVPYGNNLDYFNNVGLNNRLGLQIDLDKPMMFDTVRDYAVKGNLSTVIRYRETLYPSDRNMYRARIRTRARYNIANYDVIWNPTRSQRSALGGLSASVAFKRPSNIASLGQVTYSSATPRTGSNASIWPLDAHNNFTTTSSVVPWDGAGYLMNSFSRYSASSGLYNNYGGSERVYPLAGQGDGIAAAPTYAWRIPVGLTGAMGVSSGANRVYQILAGDTSCLVPQQSGKDPYENYSTWSEQARVAMQSGSLVPEFRISEHLRDYYDTYSGNFLTDEITGIFQVPGAPQGISASTGTSNNFFKTYSNSDFMKYFRVIDDSLDGQRSGDLKIERERIRLRMKGLIKFLPYKGFYPAERTVEIANIFSQSYGPSIIRGADDITNNNQAFRIFTEPLMAPGILYNTIKSGLAVGSVILTNTGSRTQAALPTVLGGTVDTAYAYPEGNVYFKKLLSLSTGSGARSGGYHIAKVPFETIQDPATYFSNENLIEVGRVNGINPVASSVMPVGTYAVPTGRIFDTAVWDGGATLPGANSSPRGSGATVPNIKFGTGPYLNFGDTRRADVKLSDPEGGYRYAIDNFLCETTNFFMNGITSLRSNREDQFQTVASGTVYRSLVRIYRSDADAQDDSRWDMYSRASAFGVPLATKRLNTTSGPPYPTRIKPTFSHLLPPYYSGEASAELIYSASYTGKPTVDEILSNLKIRYRRAETVPNYSASIACPEPGLDKIIPADITAGNRPGYAYPGDKTAGRLNDPRMQIDSSFNLKEKIQQVAKGTNSQQNYWLIQSKFETPILNFANVAQEAPPEAIPGSLVTNQTGPNALKTVGMWHQYGSPITSSNAGVFVEITDRGGEINSLANVVGFQKGVTVRVGDIKKSALLEEAIVAIPFITSKGTRQFFEYTGTAKETTNYANVEMAMKKYVFPPRFDFVRTQDAVEAAEAALEELITGGPIAAGTRSDKRRLALQGVVNKALAAAELVKPLMMCVFEFSAELTERDIADMWQNLPPSIESKIQEHAVSIEDRELLRVLADNEQNVRWMVFKVKKRAKRDYDVYRRSLVTSDTSALAPKLRGPYTYNWPYDYFSLVELASMDARVQWTSADMRYELDDDDTIVLDGRPPVRGTMGAPVIPGRPIPPGAPQMLDPNAPTSPTGGRRRPTRSNRRPTRSNRRPRPTASPARSRLRRQTTRSPANRTTRSTRNSRNRRIRRGPGSRRGGNY